MRQKQLCKTQQNLFRKDQEKKNHTKIFDSSHFTDYSVWDLKKEQCKSVLEVSDPKGRFCILQIPKHHPDRYGLSSSIPWHMIPAATPTSAHASPDHAAPFFPLCEQKVFAELGCKVHQETYRVGKEPGGKIFSELVSQSHSLRCCTTLLPWETKNCRAGAGK